MGADAGPPMPRGRIFIVLPADTDPAVSASIEGLIETLGGLSSGCVLAYSGGLDSTFLLKAVSLSGIKALAVTSASPTTPAHDMADARRMALEVGITHKIIETCEMQDENFLANSPRRCFHCKDELFGKLHEIASAEGLGAVLDGTNLDDLGDHRPGIEAARKHGVLSPLAEAGFTKAGIREASRALGLSTWEKPSSACLSSRIPYGTRITPEAIERVGRAEGALREMGFSALRVRDHGPVARVEVLPGDFQRVINMREKIIHKLREAGYEFVSLDLDGLKSGSMNRLIK